MSPRPEDHLRAAAVKGISLPVHVSFCAPCPRKRTSPPDGRAPRPGCARPYPRFAASRWRSTTAHAAIRSMPRHATSTACTVKRGDRRPGAPGRRRTSRWRPPARPTRAFGRKRVRSRVARTSGEPFSSTTPKRLQPEPVVTNALLEGCRPASSSRSSKSTAPLPCVRGGLGLRALPGGPPPTPNAATSYNCAARGARGAYPRLRPLAPLRACSAVVAYPRPSLPLPVRGLRPPRAIPCRRLSSASGRHARPRAPTMRAISGEQETSPMAVGPIIRRACASSAARRDLPLPAAARAARPRARPRVTLRSRRPQPMCPQGAAGRPRWRLPLGLDSRQLGRNGLQQLSGALWNSPLGCRPLDQLALPSA